MGRKRNQGKARKAARAAKTNAEAKEGENNSQSQTAATTTNGLEQSLAALPSLPQCRHGTDPLTDEDICVRFVKAIQLEFDSSCNRTNSVHHSMIAAQRATAIDVFAEVWIDPAKMETAISCFLFRGTQDILGGEYDSARVNATFARYLEQYIAVALKRTQPVYNWPKVVEAYHADMHTLVKFFRHRIPCSCLNEKYKEVKDITKMGFCYNEKCSLPNRMTERSKALYCSRCRNVTYCSRECQVSHWSSHKPDCDQYPKVLAEFDAMQQASCLVM